jgi:hypothetical protein
VFVTGISCRDSNAHGFDENIDLEYTAKWTAFFAGILLHY